MRSWRELQDEVRRCCTARCRERGVVCPPGERVPEWEPAGVRLLFVSEAPPLRRKRYFYFEDESDRLRAGLFEVLRRVGFEVRSVEEFISRGLYLVTTVKCPSERNGRNVPPRKGVIRECTERHLRHEIEYIKPEGICLLGRTARLGFSTLCERPVRVGEMFEIGVSGRSVKVMPTHWPTKRHGRFDEIIEHVRTLMTVLGMLEGA
ncbi:MAG: hypothetical protein OD815_001352 [Candidatus Alkanophagales archaeon MCA70_species_2]|nr:hypothetical protein [Candidatus Alkanophaga liquidiphilum]